MLASTIFIFGHLEQNQILDRPIRRSRTTAAAWTNYGAQRSVLTRCAPPGTSSSVKYIPTYMTNTYECEVVRKYIGTYIAYILPSHFKM